MKQLVGTVITMKDDGKATQQIWNSPTYFLLRTIDREESSRFQKVPALK